MRWSLQSLALVGNLWPFKYHYRQLIFPFVISFLFRDTVIDVMSDRSSMHWKQHWIINVASNFQKICHQNLLSLLLNALKPSMIIHECIENITESSLLHHSFRDSLIEVINDHSGMRWNHHWIINVESLFQRHCLRCLHRSFMNEFKSSLNHQCCIIISETLSSMSSMIIHECIEIITESSMLHQWTRDSVIDMLSMIYDEFIEIINDLWWMHWNCHWSLTILQRILAATMMIIKEFCWQHRWIINDFSDFATGVCKSRLFCIKLFTGTKVLSKNRDTFGVLWFTDLLGKFLDKKVIPPLKKL